MGEDKSTSVTLGTQVCFEEQLECELYQVIWILQCFGWAFSSPSKPWWTQFGLGTHPKPGGGNPHSAKQEPCPLGLTRDCAHTYMATFCGCQEKQPKGKKRAPISKIEMKPLKLFNQYLFDDMVRYHLFYDSLEQNQAEISTDIELSIPRRWNTWWIINLMKRDEIEQIGIDQIWWYSSNMNFHVLDMTIIES